jgi:hypothetical protein
VACYALDGLQADANVAMVYDEGYWVDNGARGCNSSTNVWV